MFNFLRQKQFLRSQSFDRRAPSSSYLTLLRHAFFLVGAKRRRELYGLTILLTISAIFEVVSLSAILPFFRSLSEPRLSEGLPFGSFLSRYVYSLPAEDLRFLATIVFCLLFFVSAFFRLVTLRASCSFSFGLGIDLASRVYYAALTQPYEDQIQRSTSEPISIVSTKVSETVFYVLIPLLNLATAAFMGAAAIIFLLIAIPLHIIALFSIVGISYYFVIVANKNRVRINSEIISRETTSVVRYLQEGFGGIRDIIIDSSYQEALNGFNISNNALRLAQLQNQLAERSPRIYIEAIAFLFLAATAFLLSNGQFGPQASLPLLGALAVGLQRLLTSSQQVYSSLSLMQGARASLEETLAYLEKPVSVQKRIERGLIKFSSSIKLSHISYRYPASSVYTLTNLSLEINKGERIGFIGPTGSGKSTLVDLIMGLLQPTHGEILVDGVSLDLLNIPDWQANLSHVPQDIYLKDASIRENIAFGVPSGQIDDLLIAKVSLVAQVSSFVSAMPHNYSTFVGERGVQLSGGQRQRIGIARALYKRPSLLVLDEATSALDSDTETAVMDGINSLDFGTTILMIAHRISTLESCDRIYDLGNPASFC
jgi:ATP-binding cassette subfamily B protein